MKFTTACQDHQAGKSAVKCLSQGHNGMTRVGFEPRLGYIDHNQGRRSFFFRGGGKFQKKGTFC